ncbi:HCP-like protein [Dioscorea alata]|uniref:HCP-like protein n=1 Tax=Dioscorea alata TaxID=55571 RepID=A0ACB7VPV6_DIOAL|nr:HCP-like protein [Dioscorea alata]
MLFKLSIIHRSRTRALPPLNQSLFSSAPNPRQRNNGDGEEDEAVDTIFHIVTTSPSESSMIDSLNQSPILLTNSLIDALLLRLRFSHANPHRALHFFSFTSNRRGFFHSSSSYDTMLYILGRARLFSHAWQLLVQMRRKDSTLITPKTLQIILGRIAKVCSLRQTLDSFRRFSKISSCSDTVWFNALLRTLCQEKTMADARSVYHSLKHDFKPDLQTFNILLSGWKSSDEAEHFFEEMKLLNVIPDVVSYNCLIDVYCKNREIEKARKVFDEMREREINPDVFSYTSLIGGLGLIGQPDKAKELLNEMKELGCYPDVAAYNAAIRNYCIAKRIGNAFGLMEEMMSKGLVPNATTYNLFFRVFYWANELKNAWSLYLRMRRENCLPNTQSCLFLIRLCRRQEKVEMAIELWNDMVEHGFGSFTLVSDVLFDLLCDFGKLEEAEKCFLQMVDKGHKPSNVSFRRIKVLMELAKRHDSLQTLSDKMAFCR